MRPYRPGRRRGRRSDDEQMLGGFCYVMIVIIITVVVQLICVVGAARTVADRKQSGLMVCVYPISGQYGLLPRILYYVTFAFGMVVEKHQYLVLGALASALTFAGAAAVHGLLLAFLSGEPGFDLDTVACACILNSTWSIAIWLFASAREVEQGLRRVLRLWGILTSLGSVVALTASIVARVPENVCQTKQGTVLTKPDQYDPALFNCTYSCFSGSNHFRDLGEIVAIPIEAAFSTYVWAMGVVPTLAGVILFGVSQCIRESGRYNKTMAYIIGTIPFLGTVLVWELLIIGPYAPTRPSHDSLPYGEAYNAVGQWSPWVIVALVLVAALADWGNNTQIWHEETPARTDESTEQAYLLNTISEDVSEDQPFADSPAV